STTTPAPSWPRMAGKRPSGSAPESVKSSVWQIPVALISIRTSPAFGPSRSTSTISSGFPAWNATAARVFMARFSLIDSRARFGTAVAIGQPPVVPHERSEYRAGPRHGRGRHLAHDDHAQHLVLGHLACPRRADHESVLHHDHPVGEVEDVMNVVADQEYADP